MHISIDEILKGLNDNQKDVVKNTDGPMFVIAGPGSGKTKSIMERTKYMIAIGIDPSKILLFSFTNKAATEIKDRVKRALGEDVATKITTGTYHSFCCRVLKEHAALLGYSRNFGISDSDGQKKVAKKVTEGSNVLPNDLLAYISMQKRKLITPQMAMSNEAKDNNSLASFYERYQSELFRQNLMDFDDLIFNTIKLLQQNPSVLSSINDKYQYITCDEFQDSSVSDITLISLLAGEMMNICLVGDEDQSIYSFRGADIGAVLKVDKVFKGIKLFNLAQNYRSTNTIVSAAKSVIENNGDRFIKDLFTQNEEGEQVILLEERSPQHEALRVANTIQLLVQKHGYKYSDTAILYRTGAQSRVMEEILLKSKMPHKIVSGINFYQRKEVKDLLSYLKFIENPYDEESFIRCVNVPKRGIGNVTIEKVINEAKKDLIGIDYYTACQNVLSKNLIKGTAKKGIENFCEVSMRIAGLIDEVSVPDLLRSIIKFTDFYTYLENENKEDYNDRVTNIMELIEIAHSVVDLEEFLSMTSLSSNQDSEDENNKISLMTMHMSKGLEFPIVFLIGCSETVIPYRKALHSETAIREERRLMYVGMTRAEKRLFLTRSKTIQQNGMTLPVDLSRFVREIDKRYLYKNA